MIAFIARAIRTAALATLIFWLGVFSASKFDSVLPAVPIAPDFPQQFANAVCDKNTDYLAQHISPGFGATPQDLRDGLDSIFDTCTAVDYLGSYDTAVDGATDYVFVLHYAKGSQFWVVTVYEGVVVSIQ
jgi:hypothetical protein